ncbi:MAG: alpha/beta hydrolase [Porticoccaceae bacterium]|jgi:pimeloyl-ACP methyl ester carboxylesterase|nr:alpha/beta hydrolase [Porticoccaceae bacterium]HLS99627.1 alpha/beta hydrolase [Porticoccaceae bacterium]
MTPDGSQSSSPLAPDWWRWARGRAPRDGIIEAQGEQGRLHYLRWDEGDGDGARPILLLIHGFRAHAHWWDMVAPFFTEHFRVIALDLSGMGDSDHRDHYSHHCHADDIIRLVEHLGGGPVTAVGHSFGGGRLLKACARRPELFRHGVIVDTHQLFEDMVIPPDPIGHTKPRFYPRLDMALDRFRLSPEQPDALPFLVDHIARHSLRPVDDGWTWKFDPTMQSHLFIEREADRLLPTIQVPFDLIHGSESLVVPDDLARRVHASLGNPGKRVCVPGGHHHLMLDQPVALIATLKALL